MARTGQTVVSALLPLLGDKRKGPKWSILVAIDPTETLGALGLETGRVPFVAPPLVAK